MQALILVGGEGTRLRPLTLTTPKPVLPLAGQPFMLYMLQWLIGHGVNDVVLSCGFLADGVREVLGDGSDLGIRLRYVEEPKPLGTGGALKYAEDLLDERFFMLNGDVLTDIDLTAQLRQHERTGALATLALTAVDDPSAYGLVPRNDDLSVRQFVEKPEPDQIETNLINAGAYVLHRDVLERVAPAGTPSSIERDVFPRLVGHGLFGYEAASYWLDIGTPERYLEATYDILEGRVATEVGRALQAAGGVMGDGGAAAAPPALIGRGCAIGGRAAIGPRTVLGAGVRIGDGARVEDSVILAGARIGADASVLGSVVGPGATVGERCELSERVVLGQGVDLGSDNVLRAGARIFPGVSLPDGAIRF